MFNKVKQLKTNSMISGNKREVKDFTKYCGLFEAEVICVNPTAEEFKEILGRELTEDSKAADYLGESKEGNTSLRINFWLRNVKTQEIFSSPVGFFLEDKKRANKDETKLQYINTIGTTTWADDVDNLPEWFANGREYRVAHPGEEELYEFLRMWLGKLDYRHEDTAINLDWKKLMKGNVKELRDQIGGEYACNVGVLATVVSRENAEGEIKEYQGIYNKAFLPVYAIKNFRLVDYSDPDIVAKISAKKPKDQKAHEKFVIKVMGEYGCKDAFYLKDIQEYNPADFIVSSDKVIDESNPSY